MLFSRILIIMILSDLLLEKFKNQEAENLGVKRICELFEAKSQFEKNAVRKAIEELEAKGEIVYKNGRFVLFENSGLLKGTFKGNERGFGFVVTDAGDFFVPPKMTAGALDGDIVVIEKVVSKRGSTDEAQVKSILQRGVKRLVGTYEAESGFGFVVPDDKNFSVDLYVHIKNSRGAKNGDKVYCEIISYPENRRNPEAKVLEILGKKFDLKAEELSIIKSYGYELEFPQKVEKELEKVPETVSESEIKGRKDFRNELIITIDGEDSRDFDDAVSVKKIKGGFELGVHIADVSHYVKRSSEIGKEALSRSTSVYFPERVIPMLPKKLSNGICSLNEGVDRLTLSLIMKIDNSGNVFDFEIHEGVIRSKKRMTYTAVQKMLEGDSETLGKYAFLAQMISDANELKNTLEQKRQKRGNIDLSVKESHILVDNNGNITVEPRGSVEAYKIIEEFMIVANETVAEYVYYMNLPFVYRVHEKPESEKAEGFKNFLNALGINVKWSYETCHPKDYQTLLEKLKGTPIFSVVNKVMLRSMQKAKYSPNNIGHFGLSSKCYCHFTSPIRRYPDLVVHSVLKDILKGVDIEAKYSSFVSEASNISSENEKRADEAERTMDDFYKCRYMRKYIGHEFNAVISGVTSFGVFVELESTVEGLVRLETLPRGSYAFDEKTYSLKSNSRAYTLGDEVVVRVLGVDNRARRVEMRIVEDKYSKKTVD